MAVPARTVSHLGVSWVREDFHWHRVQPAPDVWDWTFTDAAMHELLKRDVQVLGVLGPSVGWATRYRRDTDHDVSFYAPDPDDFVQYAREVVNRYGDHIKHWEIWNEPDNPIFWKPDPDPQAYADLLMRTSAAIKRIDPEAQVLIGGFNPFDTTFIHAVAAEGAWDSFDIIAIHPYVDPYSPEQGHITAALDRVQAMFYRFGAKPVWATEIGWASGPGDRDTVGYTDEQAQASFLVRSLLLLWSAGVERSFWYMLKDDAHNPYGLVEFGRGRTDFRMSLRKPVFYAFRTLNNELHDTTFVGRRDLFSLSTLLGFEATANWRRTNQPNGSLNVTDNGLARVVYDFSTDDNDYVVFERIDPVPIQDDTYALGVWVYGDGSDHSIKVWLRDAEGELLQFPLGVVGQPGWRFISGPINAGVGTGNRIEGEGNGHLDFPASLAALVLDDSHDAFTGLGTIYLDTLTMVSGREVYNFRLMRDRDALDIIWSPANIRVRINTNAVQGYLVERDGEGRHIAADDNRFTLTINADPIFLWHRR
jgi:hypothetical protein